jgi:hypothetical protein
MTAALPRPVVHYEMIRRDPRNPLRVFPEDLKSKILHDPFNERGDNPLPAQTVSAYSTTYNMMRSAIAYERTGQQVVVLGPRMQEAFANTSLSEVSPEHVRFPHSCFYLATPGSKIKLWGGSDTGWHRVEGAYIMEEPTEPGVLSMLIWGAANERSKAPTDDATFWFAMKIGSGATVNLDSDLESRLDDNELREGTLRNIELESAVTRMDLDARVNGVLDNRHANISDRLANIPQSEELAREVKGQVKAFLRIAINTLLYINSTSCETKTSDNEAQRKELEQALARKKHKNGKDAKKLGRDLDNLPKYRVTWIGPTIETSAGSETDLTGTRSVKGHVRRGHWHTYRVGPRKTEAGEKIDAALRKSSLKWIAPVWVGSGAPEDKPRVYGVREPVSP